MAELIDTTGMTTGELRDTIWTTMLRSNVATYPLPPYGHHPNFKGAKEAAYKLVDYLFQNGKLKAQQTVLCYPDYVLKPLRKYLLEQDVNVVVPAKYKTAYRLLNAKTVNPSSSSSISGAEKEGELIPALGYIDFAFLASVAIAQNGYSLSKGYGFRLPTLACKKASIVHSSQLIYTLPEDATSFNKLDYWATPDSIHDLPQ